MVVKRRPTIKTLLLLTTAYAIYFATYPYSVDATYWALIEKPLLVGMALLLAGGFIALPVIFSLLCDQPGRVALGCGVTGAVIVGAEAVVLLMMYNDMWRVGGLLFLYVVPVLSAPMTPAEFAMSAWSYTSDVWILLAFESVEVLIYAFYGWLIAKTCTVR